MYRRHWLLEPCTHTVLFQRLYNVHNVRTMSYKRQHDVVCVLGGTFPQLIMEDSYISMYLRISNILVVTRICAFTINVLLLFLALHYLYVCISVCIPTNMKSKHERKCEFFHHKMLYVQYTLYLCVWERRKSSQDWVAFLIPSFSWYLSCFTHISLYKIPAFNLQKKSYSSSHC